MTEADPAGRAAERARRIIGERTAALAARSDTASAAPDRLVLACAVGREIHAIPLEAVAEVLPPRRIVPVPGAASPILGAIGLRGRLCSVIDLGAALGIGAAAGAEADAGHLLLLRGAQRIALRVDRAIGVVAAAPLPDGREPSEMARRGVSGYALARAGVATAEATLVGLLDVDALLAPVLKNTSVPGA